MSRVVVFGSINVDLVAEVARLPGPGETIKTDSYVALPGGKGANQALAAARNGAATHMVGAVGQTGRHRPRWRSCDPTASGWPRWRRSRALPGWP